MVLADRYELVRLIARGGMSEVFEAVDRVLGRSVAVKLYRATAVADRRRLEAEVQILASLNHPGLVHLYDVGEHRGDEFVVIELIDGPTLASVLARRGALPEADLQDLAAVVADALAFVHASGIAHRDVTPSNILCGSDGRARLADFGIARLLDMSRVTAVAQTIGTAAYMAPEQVEGHDVTSAADVYALGLVLLEALTGRRGFQGVGHEVTIARLTRDPDVETGVPARWRPLLRAMTRRDPRARPSATEVRERAVALPVTDEAATTERMVAAPARTEEPLAQTAAISAVDGGTAVMPLVEHPDGTADTTSPSSWAPVGVTGRLRRPLVIAALALMVVVGLAVATSQENPAPDDEPRTEVIVSSTVPTTVATTAPPTTSAPVAPVEGRGKGGGKRHR